MSITITCEFDHPYQANQAAEKLRSRGYTARSSTKATKNPALLIAYPFGTVGGNDFGNNLMAALPPLSGNGVLLHTPPEHPKPLVTVLADDTQTEKVGHLLHTMGGRIL